MASIKPPLIWIGNKRRLAPVIVSMLPLDRTHTYVEAFGGSAAVLLAKPPSPVEVYNDLDERLVNLFRVVRDEQKCKRLEQMLRWTPLSRREKQDATRRLKGRDWRDDVEFAYLFLIHVNQSFGATGRSWRVSKTSNAARSWSALPDLLEPLRIRLANVAIECMPWQRLIDLYDSERTCFYLDPPYHPQTCTAAEYQFSMSASEHRELVERLLSVRGMVVLSGYWHKDYLPLEEAGWELYEITASCQVVGRTRSNRLIGARVSETHPRVECLWRSPSCKSDIPLSLTFECTGEQRHGYRA